MANSNMQDWLMAVGGICVTTIRVTDVAVIGGGYYQGIIEPIEIWMVQNTTLPREFWYWTRVVTSARKLLANAFLASVANEPPEEIQANEDVISEHWIAGWPTMLKSNTRVKYPAGDENLEVRAGRAVEDDDPEELGPPAVPREAVVVAVGLGEAPAPAAVGVQALPEGTKFTMGVGSIKIFTTAKEVEVNGQALNME